MLLQQLFLCGDQNLAVQFIGAAWHPTPHHLLICPDTNLTID